MANASRYLDTVREILFREWDPIGVNCYEQASDEYDSYVPEVLRLLVAGADEHKLASRLSEFQRVSMGMTMVDDELHRRVARRLLTLPVEAVPSVPPDNGRV